MNDKLKKNKDILKHSNSQSNKKASLSDCISYQNSILLQIESFILLAKKHDLTEFSYEGRLYIENFVQRNDHEDTEFSQKGDDCFFSPQVKIQFSKKKEDVLVSAAGLDLPLSLKDKSDQSSLLSSRSNEYPAHLTHNNSLLRQELREITSPFVGTFYSSPSPQKPVFVKVGDIIQAGKVLCIVEAMKVMNEIESDITGEIAEICVQNEDVVEYGQVLFRVKI
jgi:acetyl-CoA carboxylase biotin carboxyl carrier protein